MPTMTVVDLRPAAARQAVVPPCLRPDADPEDWFPEPKDETPELAAALCAGCPARARMTCLDEAARLGAGHGIWGGLTSAERRSPGADRTAVDAVRDPAGYVELRDGRTLTRTGWTGAAA